MNVQEMYSAFAESQAGRLTFPEVIRRSMAAGTESYFCDLARGAEIFYGVDGETGMAPMTLPLEPVAVDYSAEGVAATIRAAQAYTIRYPEIVRRLRAAGVIAYWVYMT